MVTNLDGAVECYLFPPWGGQVLPCGCLVASRQNSDEGIGYAEFSYQILQGMDYLQLHRDYGPVLQTGGSDHWGNGQSEGNTTWLNAGMCGPSAFYQFWPNTADADVVDRLKGVKVAPARRSSSWPRPWPEDPMPARDSGSSPLK
jgi:hypothetical protein